MLTWPGGRAMQFGLYWRAYISPIDAHREFHWTSSGGYSIPKLVIDDYGDLVPVEQ